MTEKAADAEVLRRLRADAARIGSPFGLRCASLRAARRDAKLYGVCDDLGHIRIRLRAIESRRSLPYGALIDTLCHELAHLQHFDHSREFWNLYELLRARAEKLGLCRPRKNKQRSRQPCDQPFAQQLVLFPNWTG